VFFFFHFSNYTKIVSILPTIPKSDPSQSLMKYTQISSVTYADILRQHL
jgi:hypothetical protein